MFCKSRSATFGTPVYVYMCVSDNILQFIYATTTNLLWFMLGSARWIDPRPDSTASGGVHVREVSMHRPKSVLPWLRHKAFAWNVTTIPIEAGAKNVCRAACGFVICKCIYTHFIYICNHMYIKGVQKMYIYIYR